MSSVIAALEQVDTPEEIAQVVQEIEKAFSILHAVQTKVQALLGVFRRCCHEQGSSPLASPNAVCDRKTE